MGAILGGNSAQERALEEQNRLRAEEADRARREAEIRLAEKKAKKGQETANIKIGTDKKEPEILDEKQSRAPQPTLSSALGLGGNKSKTGIQL